MAEPRGPAYRIETARTSMCCFEPADTALLDVAIAESLDHLAPFMPWVRHEPAGFARRLTWLRTQRGHFDLDSDYTYGVFTKDHTMCLGVASLILSPEVGERRLGYWIHAAHVRQGLATEVTAALVRVAFTLCLVDTLEIELLPENEASCALALKLGFSGPVVSPQALSFGDGERRDTHLYALTRLAYRALPPSARSACEAFDALGRPLFDGSAP